VDLDVRVPVVGLLVDVLLWRLAWSCASPIGCWEPPLLWSSPQPCEGTAASTGYLVEKGKLLRGVFSRNKVRPVWPLDLRGPHLLNADVLPLVGGTSGNISRLMSATSVVPLPLSYYLVGSFTCYIAYAHTRFTLVAKVNTFISTSHIKLKNI
jgi:hypothetical protein